MERERESNSNTAHNDDGVRRDNDDEVHKVQEPQRGEESEKIKKKKKRKNKQIVNKFSAPAPSR